MIATIRRTYTAEIAHRLPLVPEGHKCGRLHGHSMRLTVAVRGEVDALGMVLDFAEVDRVVKPIVEGELCHYYLNGVAGLENPTSENVAAWLLVRIVGMLPVWSVTVGETCRSEVELLASDARGAE
jgi:6-pyruvoyltetrahydropterin/6-carboxytetrahydropterin synthase